MSCSESNTGNDTCFILPIFDDSTFMQHISEENNFSNTAFRENETWRDISKQKIQTFLSLSTKTATDGLPIRLVWRCLQKAVKFYLNNYVLLILTAICGTALNVTSIKVLSERVSVFQITAIRSSVCTIFLLLLGRWKRVSLIQPRKQVPLFLLRGILGAIAFLGLALSTFELPLSESAFISNSYPVVTAVLSWLLGMEHLGLLSWAGVCGCFIGNALIANPPFLFGRHEDWEVDRIIGILAACIGNLVMGGSIIVIRHIGKDVNAITLTTYMHLFTAIMSLPFLCAGFPISASWSYSVNDILCYCVTCAMGICIQLASTRALQIGPPTKVSSLYMTNMLLSGFVGIVALSEKMSLFSGIGAGIIIVSVLMITAQKPKRTNSSKLVPNKNDVEEIDLADQKDDALP